MVAGLRVYNGPIGKVVGLHTGVNKTSGSTQAPEVSPCLIHFARQYQVPSNEELDNAWQRKGQLDNKSFLNSTPF